MSVGLQIIVGLTPLACFLVLFLCWRYFKRGFSREEETITEHHELLLTLCSSILFGNFLFHGLPRAVANDYTVLIVFPFVGFYVMVVLSKTMRIFDTRSNRGDADPHVIIDPKTQEVADYVSVSEGEDTAATLATVNDEDHELFGRRRPIVILAYIILLFQGTLDGLFLYYEGVTALSVVAFLVDKILESIAISALLVYGIAPRKWWAVTSLVFGVATLLGNIPVFAVMPQPEIDALVVALNSVWLKMFIGFSSGALLWISMYYIALDKRRPSRKDNVVRLIVFAIGASFSWLTALVN